MTKEEIKYKALRYYAWTIAKHNADDLLHEFFLRSYTACRDVLRDDYNISYCIKHMTWLYRDILLKEQTRYVYEQRYVALQDKNDYYDVVVELTYKQAEQFVQNKINEKTKHTKTKGRPHNAKGHSNIFMLYKAGLGTKEIANILGLSYTNTEKKINRINSWLKPHKSFALFARAMIYSN